LLIVDEAYIDFADTDESAIALVKRFPNLVVLRTFSKAFSLAGMRVGLAFGSEDIVRNMLKVKDSYNLCRLSLTAALDFLSGKLGDDPWLWRWGDLHYAEMRHQAFGPIPLLNRLTTIRIAANGSRHTVNKAAMNYRDANPFAARQGAGFRGVYDFSDLKKSCFTISSGQSGNCLFHEPSFPKRMNDSLTHEASIPRRKTPICLLQVLPGGRLT